MGGVVQIDTGGGGEDGGGIEEPPLFYFEEEKFADWTARCEPTVAEALANLLRRLLQLWSDRFSRKALSREFFLEFMRVMSVHGVPFGCRPHLLSKDHDMYTLECRHKFYSVSNLDAFFRTISRFENACRWNGWMAEKTAETRDRHKLRLKYSSSRGQYLFQARDLNYRAALKALAASPLLRRNIKPWEVLGACDSFDCALQVAIANERDFHVDVGETLLTLAKNCVLKLTFVKSKNPVLKLLTEAVTTAMAQGDRAVAAEIAKLEEKVDKKVKYIDGMNLLFAYRLLERFLSWKNRGLNVTTMNDVFAEELADQFRIFPDERGTVFVMATVIVYASIGKHGPLMKLVTQFMRTCPGAVGIIHQLLEKLDLTDEADVAIEAAGNSQEQQLHPSDRAWLLWCENRLSQPTNYGPLEEVFLGCVRVLFNFLDFGENRREERAWFLLWTFIQSVDVANVAPLWKERSSWWPRFHSTALSPQAESHRDQVLAALQVEASVNL